MWFPNFELKVAVKRFRDTLSCKLFIPASDFFVWRESPKAENPGFSGRFWTRPETQFYVLSKGNWSGQGEYLYGAASPRSDPMRISYRFSSKKSATKLKIEPFWSPKVRQGLALEPLFHRGQGCRGRAMSDGKCAHCFNQPSTKAR